ncbi:MAG: GNAT family N-acetyltransferase [Ardenticatenaceae bacterium]|nr:GNAT family N-acetyltransferase [Ardenticatenaceae bacterium]
MLQLREVENEQDEAQAWQLIREYLDWLNGRLQQDYQLHLNVAGMMAEDKAETEKFVRPHGRFYLALSHGTIAGVGRLKKLDDEVAELKRMYVRPEFRGLGIGRLLLNQLITDARTIGYQKLRLDSLRFLTAAYHLYTSVGFYEIDTYPGQNTKLYASEDNTDTQHPLNFFMEMDLSA